MPYDQWSIRGQSTYCLANCADQDEQYDYAQHKDENRSQADLRSSHIIAGRFAEESLKVHPPSSTEVHAATRPSKNNSRQVIKRPVTSQLSASLLRLVLSWSILEQFEDYLLSFILSSVLLDR